MNRNDYDDSLLRQARRMEEYVKIVYQSVLSQVKKLPVKEIWDVQKIFISGCGDSWLAGIAAKPAFESITNIETNAIRAIEFSRFLSNKNLGYSPNTPLVILCQGKALVIANTLFQENKRRLYTWTSSDGQY